MAKALTSPVFMIRILTILLGIVIIGVGLYSHFQSDWSKEPSIPIPDYYSFKLGIMQNQCPGLDAPFKLYKICEFDRDTRCDVEIEKPCPNISMEIYYVSIIIICFVLSLLLLIASFILDMSSRTLKLADMGCHGVSALLLLVGAILYIVSAEQINNIVEYYDLQSNLEILGITLKQRRVEKIVAASLTIAQAVLYGVAAILIGRQDSD